MARTAYLPIGADRYTPCVRIVRLIGLDLTGIAQRMQVRTAGDVPGAPLVDLQSVDNANAQGLWLKSVAPDELGRPVSTVIIRINEATIEALPYAGELGQATVLAYDWQVTIGGDRRRLAKGPFPILGDGVTGADAAPVNRVAGGAFTGPSVVSPYGSVTLTFGDEIVQIVIEGADALAPLVVQATNARDAVKPLYGNGDPSPLIGVDGSWYRDMTDPLSPIEWFKTGIFWTRRGSLKGNPGGNVMAIGLFAEVQNMVIDAGTDRVRASGYSQVGVGGGDAVYDPNIGVMSTAVADGWAWVSKNGRGYRLTADQPLSLLMLGWKTDYVSPTQRGTDNAPVLARLKSFLSATSDARGTLYRYTPEIRLPLGRGYTTASPNFDYGTLSLIGVRQGVTDSDGLGGSVIVTAERIAGLTTNAADTSGENSRPLGFGSTGSYVSGVTMLSLGGNPGDAADGFRARGQTTYVDCIAVGYARHGFNLSADLSGQGGNTNASYLMNCTAVRNYLDGFYFQGGDGSAISSVHLNARYNGRCGINLAQFLANSLFGFHLEANGTNQSGPVTMPQQAGAQCRYNGRYYVIYPGRAADAIDSTPGVVAGVWIDRGPGPAHPVYPEYQSVTQWTEGSAMRVTSANAQTVCAGGYAEPGQPPVFIGGGGMQLGGQMDAGVIGGRAYLYVSGGMLTAAAFQVISGTETIQLGGEPETRLFQRYRTDGFFAWNATGSPLGDFNFGGGNTGGPVWSARQTDNQMRIAKPLLASLRVESAIAPIGVGAVARYIPVFDAAGNELGLVPVMARA